MSSGAHGVVGAPTDWGPVAVFRGENRVAASVLLLSLGAITLAAWAYTIVTGAGMSSAMLVMTVTGGGAWGVAIFLSIWFTMMVAMMFPAAAPMVQAYVRLAKPEESSTGWLSARSGVFIGTYIAVWGAIGLIVAFLYAFLPVWVPALTVSGTLGPQLAGAVLLAAGVYQTTPLKQVCLNGCRTPVSFLMTEWRPGVSGAIRLGLRHAAFCVGCCWLLFAVLFAVGLMALPWMALLALLIFVEKLFPGRQGFAVSATLGIGMAAVGVVFLAVPEFGRWALGLG
jgi:predicted metal-binding membrane protein